METDRISKRIEAITLFVVMAFLIILCFYRIRYLENRIVDIQSRKEMRVIYDEDADTTKVALPEGYHLECDGKDLILTED